jgi:hypothetical protein
VVHSVFKTSPKNDQPRIAQNGFPTSATNFRAIRLRGTILLHLTEVAGVSIYPRTEIEFSNYTPKMAKQESGKTASPVFQTFFEPSFMNMQSAA